RIEDDDWFDLRNVEVLNYEQRLNLREGILYRDVTFRDKAGRETQLTERRFVHMRYSHLGGVELALTANNWSGKVTIRSAIDGRVVNNGDDVDSRFSNAKHLEMVESFAKDDICYLKMRTNCTKLEVAEATRTEFLRNVDAIEPERKNIEEDEFVAQEVT